TLFFFFRAEDGIRDFHVTGVQTCALPIYSCFLHFSRSGPGTRAFVSCSRCCPCSPASSRPSDFRISERIRRQDRRAADESAVPRSEERRVGKESSSRWLADH